MKWKRKKSFDPNGKVCICDGNLFDSQMIQCCNEDCPSPWWHVDCAGLNGITKSAVRSIKWKCPCCVFNVFKEQLVCEDVGIGGSANELKTQIVDELKLCLPQLISNFAMSNSTKSNLSNETVDCDKQMKHTLLLQPHDPATSTYSESSWAEVVQHHLPDKLSEVPVKKVGLTSGGKGYMSFPDEESRNIAAESLKENFCVKMQDKSVKSTYPKLKISGIDKKVFNTNNLEELKNAILLKNDALKEMVIKKEKLFEIMFFLDDKRSSQFGSVVVKVDLVIRQMIQNRGNKIFLGLSSCFVTDRVHLTQCYTCQEFGHKAGSPACKVKEGHVCLYCSENHLSRECPQKRNKAYVNFKCSNCSKSSNPHVRSKAGGHSTTSYECPTLQAELKAVLSKTMGMDPKNELPRNVIVT